MEKIMRALVVIRAVNIVIEEVREFRAKRQKR